MAAKIKEFNIPINEYNRLERFFFPDIKEFFKSEKGQNEYNEWLKAQAEKDND